MAFRWQADDGPLIVVFRSFLPLSTKEKTLSKLEPILKKLSWSVHAFPCGVLSRVWYLIVLIPDLCLLPYFTYASIFFNSIIFFKVMFPRMCMVGVYFPRPSQRGSKLWDLGLQQVLGTIAWLRIMSLGAISTIAKMLTIATFHPCHRRLNCSSINRLFFFFNIPHHNNTV